MTTIYMLRDPRDNAVHYVGRTGIALRVRLSHHISEARGARAGIHPLSAKNRWILDLEALELRPRVAFLEDIPEDPHGMTQRGRGFDREVFWIEQYLEEGAVLFNLAHVPQHMRAPVPPPLEREEPLPPWICGLDPRLYPLPQRKA